jgi:hypothetical protein
MKLYDLLPDACPSPDCHPGDRPATVPARIYEKRGRHLAEYQCSRGHKWVTRWGQSGSSDGAQRWPIERGLVGEFPSEQDASSEIAALEDLLARRHDSSDEGSAA